MLFSQFFKIEKNEDCDWFDPILFRDTKLFIDPFLIFKSNHPNFQNAHEELIWFFNKAFNLGVESQGIRRHPAHKKLEAMLLFPEVSEICLGYTAGGTGGSGSGGGFSKAIIAGILESISLGLTEVTHFEEIALFHQGIGPDRISDITANILKRRFINYTQEVCRKFNIPTRRVRLANSDFDYDFLRWEWDTVQLPWNPYSERGIILVPQEFLRTLPVISPEEFWEHLWTDKGEQLRNDFNYEIKSKINKADIIKLARENRFWVRDYLEFVENKARPTEYDLQTDSKGLYLWGQETSSFVNSNPQQIDASSKEEFKKAINLMVSQYQHFVQENAGYRLLWDDKFRRPKSEEASQLLFVGIVKNYCIANDIDLNRETNIGRGPVDFKFSSGYESRALLEVKLANNSKFWRNLHNQLPAYLSAEQITLGYYLIIVYRRSDFKKLTNIQKTIDEISKETGTTLEAIVVDATAHKPSASKI